MDSYSLRVKLPNQIFILLTNPLQKGSILFFLFFLFPLLQEEVGRGRFGTVYRCVNNANPNVERAAKFIRCIRAKDKEQVYGEVAIMNKLRNPKLLQLAAAFEHPKEIVLVME